MATHSSILAWRISWSVACQAPLSIASQELDTTLATKPPSPSIVFQSGCTILHFYASCFKVPVFLHLPQSHYCLFD